MTDGMLETAVALHQQGDLAQAERLYRRVLEDKPADADALHLMGILCLQAGQPRAAADWISRSLSGNAQQPVAHLNLGVALQSLSRIEEALGCFDRALELAPQYAEALNNRGDALLALQRPAQALRSLDRAVELQPNFAVALNNRGNALRALGRFDDALASYESALRAEPDLVRALNNRGGVLRDLKRLEQALACFEQALHLDRNYAPALYNRGNALLEMRRHAEALASFERLLELQPDDADACAHRGIALLELDRPEDALASLDRALRLSPDLVPALINRGSALQRLGRIEEGLESLERALELDPDNAAALNNCGNALLDLNRFAQALTSFSRALELDPDNPEIYCNRAKTLRTMERFDDALLDYRQALRLKSELPDALFNSAMIMTRLRRHREADSYFQRLDEIEPGYAYAHGAEFLARSQLCDWTDREPRRTRLIDEVSRGLLAAAPFAFLSATDSPADQLECARTNARIRYPARPDVSSAPASYRHQRLRLAYVSGDLRNHAVAHLIVGLIECHDRERFEVNAISFKPPDASGIGRRVHRAFDRFVHVGERSDADIAALMRAMQIDIAIDLAGYTEGNRLGVFAHRAAPVQAQFLGYAGTTGTPFMDYILADEVVIPRGEERWYSEQVVRLPHCYLPNDAQREIAPVPSRREAGLPEEGFVFCAFTNAYKINPQIFEVWMRLLDEVPGSVLWLRAMGADTRDNLEREVRRRGVASGRLLFAPQVADMAEHLARLSLADLYLDTLPYNAHSSTCDALWSGVPVLTCAGHSFAGRVAASALTAADLPELITDSLESYRRKARELAQDPEQLQGLRRRLERNRRVAPLFDTVVFARHLEAAYQTMHARAARGEPAAGFSVEHPPV